MRKTYQIFLTFLLIFSTTFSFHIAPTFFEKRIDVGGGYQEFTMYNNSTKTQRFKVTALPGTGKYGGHMDKWVEYNPKIITIKPKSQSILKVYVKAPKGTPEGEYSTFLNFKAIPVPDLMKKTDTSLNVAARMGVMVNMEVIGYVGDIKSNLEIKDLKITENKDGKVVIKFMVINKTDKRGSWYNIDIMNANTNYKTIEKGRIGRGKTHEIELVMDDMKKRDIVGIRLRDSSTNEEIVKKEL